jgi:hypothetical protein
MVAGRSTQPLDGIEPNVVAGAMKRAAAATAICICLGASWPAFGTLPSIKFGDLARKSECIFVADRVDDSGNGTEPNSPAGGYHFVPLAIVGGSNCDVGSIEVYRQTTEAPGSIGKGTFLLFLSRRDAGSFGYTQEPWSILGIRNGAVSTLYFLELGEWMPLDEVLKLIRRERQRKLN